MRGTLETLLCDVAVVFVCLMIVPVAALVWIGLRALGVIDSGMLQRALVGAGRRPSH